MFTLSSRLKAVESERDALLDCVTMRAAENEELLASLKRTQVTLQKLGNVQQENLDVLANNRRIEEALFEARNTITKQKAELEKLSREYVVSQNRLTNLTERVEASDEAADVNENRIENLKSSVDKLLAEKDQLKKDLHEATVRNNYLRNENIDLRQQLSVERDAYQQTITRMKLTTKERESILLNGIEEAMSDLDFARDSLAIPTDQDPSPPEQQEAVPLSPSEPFGS